MTAAIERTLSSEQFRTGVTYFATARAGDKEAAPPASADIYALVKAAVDERTKDKDVIAVDLATKAADRLMSWTKMFGVFAALPIAAFLALLSFMGISSFQDLQNVKTRAEASVRSLADASKQVDDQLAELRNHLNANVQQIEGLKSRVDGLEEKLKFSAANFLRYFQELGYVPKMATVNVSTNVKIPGGLSYYDPDSNTIVIKPELIEDETLLLHEYAHSIMYSSLSFDALIGNPKWKNATPLGMEAGDPLPIDPTRLNSPQARIRWARRYMIARPLWARWS